MPSIKLKSQTKKRKPGGGRKPKLNPEQAAQLVELTLKNPTIALDDLVLRFRKTYGITISKASVRRYLRLAGVVRVRPSGNRSIATVQPTITGEATVEPPRTGEATVEPPRIYGYTEAHRDEGESARYPCGLTDSEWEQVHHLFEKKGPGRPPRYPRRQMLDACIYVLRSGCSWRMMPKDFPPWKLVYATFRRWQSYGLFETMYDQLRALWRTREHRAPAPTAAVIDSQSVKTSPQGGPKGYDAGKKVKGRKRHLITDTLGLLLAVLITVASVQDRDAADPILERAKEKYPSIQKLFADGGYQGQSARDLAAKHEIDVEIVRRSDRGNIGRFEHPDQLPLFQQKPARADGFVVLPKRWVVERSNAWNERPRRMNRDHDRNLDVSEAWIWLTEARMLLRRVSA